MYTVVTNSPGIIYAVHVYVCMQCTVVKYIIPFIVHIYSVYVFIHITFIFLTEILRFHQEQRSAMGCVRYHALCVDIHVHICK